MAKSKSKHASQDKPKSKTAAADLTAAELEAAARAVLARISTVTAALDDPAPAAKSKALPRKSAARSLWDGHRAFFAPFGWIAVTDATALALRAAVHVAGTGGQAAGLTALTVTGAAVTRTVIRVRRRKDKKTGVPVSPPARRAARRRAVRAWAAAASWALLVIWWTPAGPYGMIQVTVILGGLWLSRDHLFAHRHRHLPRQGQPAAITAGPARTLPGGTDPRLEAFIRRFVTGTAAGRRLPPLGGAELHSPADVRDGAGFSFGIRLDPNSGITYTTVLALRGEIAALYDVPADQVLIDRGPRRSESRAQVTVLTAVDAYAEPERWDGVSTYDPATGCIDFGRYGDGQITHARMHEPGSGTWGAIIVGGPGTGKTGDAHVLAGEYGTAMLCAACGPAGTCPQCDPRRICFLIMCDPQMQPFSVWRGRADLTAWGPLATIHVMAMMREALTERAAGMGTEEWTDSKGRTCHGRGWFDPAPQRPAVQAFVDEWPLVVAAPGGDQAVRDAGAIEKEHRKAGGSLNWLAQLPDAGETGDSRAIREVAKSFNVIGHRLDGTSRSMVGIDGDVRDLPEGVYGTGYIGGADNRSGVVFRTKEFPESADDGIDVRDIADRIAATPVTLDDPVLRVFRKYGYTGRCQVIDDEFVIDWRKEQARQARRNGQRPAASGPVPAQGQPGAGPVSTGALEAVAHALRDHVAEHGQPAELYDVMTATGLAAGPAGRALAALAADGRARQAGPGTWSPAAQQPEGATV